MTRATDVWFGVRNRVNGTLRLIRGRPEFVAIAFALVGLLVRPKGALATVWWGGTAAGSLVAAMAILQQGGK